MQSFRFIHASRVQLDSPVIIPGECTPADRQLAEDASILAFRSLVEDCISRDADLLLLTGDTFGASLVTLREQMELEQGLKKLSEHDVAVVIVPGPEDPASAWREHIQLPDGVVLADIAHPEPIRIFHDGHEVAAVFPVAVVDDAGRAHGCQLPAVRGGIYRIGLIGTGSVDHECLREVAGDSASGSIHIQLDSRGADAAEQAFFDAVSHSAVNYLAVGVAGRRQTQIAGSVTVHNPGPLQALDAEITGTCGATLVSVGADGKSQIEQLPNARIRWEWLSINACDVQSIEDLAIEMEHTLNTLTAANHEELWIVHWHLAISGQLTSELQRTSLTPLWELIDSTSQPRPTCRHILHVAAHVGDVSEAGEHHRESDNLEDHLRGDLEQVVKQASHAEWSGTPWGRRVLREAGKLSPAKMLPKVRQAVSAALNQTVES